MLAALPDVAELSSWSSRPSLRPNQIRAGWSSVIPSTSLLIGRQLLAAETAARVSAEFENNSRPNHRSK